MDLQTAEKYVEENDNAWWDNYTLNIFTPTEQGERHKLGYLRKDTLKWGVLFKFDPDEKGTWQL